LISGFLKIMQITHNTKGLKIRMKNKVKYINHLTNKTSPRHGSVASPDCESIAKCSLNLLYQVPLNTP
jgi:ABC-type enterochelin transport system substrate-binding protein